jgi:hypothetical protein
MELPNFKPSASRSFLTNTFEKIVDGLSCQLKGFGVQGLGFRV